MKPMPEYVFDPPPKFKPTHVSLLVLAVYAAFLVFVYATAPVNGFDPGQAPPVNGAKSDVPPVLAEVDRLKIINASQQVEIWTLKLQQAASEVQKARAELDRLVSASTPTGWQMNEKLEFVPKKADK